MNETIHHPPQNVEDSVQFVDPLINEMKKVIVGQDYMIERLIIGLITGGHILLEGVPGLAKTLAVQTLSTVINATFKRIQFTPDLLPSDIIGSLVYNQTTQEFSHKRGPIFANIVLADEINRAPAKVQSALLEAMQEYHVTIGDVTYPLDHPFLVLATQNPIEHEGTYVLPEAQVDRFIMKLNVQYPSKDEEKMIIDRMTQPSPVNVSAVISIEDIVQARDAVSKVYVDEKIKEYVLDIVFSTRQPEEYQLNELINKIEYGASPRASIALIQAAKAHAFIKKRGYVIPEDIKSIASDVLRHRIIPTFDSEAHNQSSDDLVDIILSEIAVP